MGKKENHKRWRDRHAAELRARRRQKARPPIDREPADGSPQWRCFELVDPRDGLPRYVGAGKGWQRLWELREQSGGRLAAWFRELDSLGLKPIESAEWCLTVAVDDASARHLAQARLQQIVAWAAGWPEWLLNARQDARQRPVIRRWPDGRTERFATVCEAARMTGTTRRTVKSRVSGGYADSDGCTWFDDFADG